MSNPNLATAASRPKYQRPRQSLSPRKRALLQAAVRCFRKRGYHGTTINHIGAEAGVSGPALYAHFRSKEEVLEAAIWEIGRELSAGARSVIDAEMQPRAALEQMVRSFIEVALDQRDAAAVYVFEARYLPAEAYSAMQRSSRRYRELWVDLVRDVRPDLSETRARTMVKIAQQFALFSCLEDPEIDPEHLVSMISQMTLAGLLNGM